MTGFLHIGVSRLARLHAPVIASINGVAAGAGLSLMAICNIAIACNLQHSRVLILKWAYRLMVVPPIFW